MMKEKPYAKLRGKMAEKGISQERLAKAIGISKTALSMKLSGEREFRFKEMECIYKVLELEDVQSYFFGC